MNGTLPGSVLKQPQPAAHGLAHRARTTARSPSPSRQPDQQPVRDWNPRDPLDGITLESIINQLVQRHGWSEMGRRIPIRCFQFNPTVKSSLTFLRKTPWARKKVEDWFIAELPRP